ncbi:endonuclease/exonuclease/phosphatase family protein [Streptomyces sp. ME19-01-6]|uniref:endonuclease/exonuclease/phosphatase family protein n=1 Tax=Streptomyces sp. ME19-01-6 TaxID=3028686 RepID=UPI0029AA41BE|nr:endonuclease/exonuclease/phosphatase family protein [Streptomyces sp. ME19-01-6]MDX3224559.1 endonuclease/exonuclease/phosphatase family protein [Streptomyces sp. ME19-01-6]
MTTNGDQLSLLSSQPPRHPASTTKARLVILNAQHASPGRSARQAEWLGSQETADLVVISEVGQGPGGDALVTALADNGYASVLAPAPTTSDYRTVLASRTQALEPVESGISFLPHRAPAAAVRIGECTIGLLGLYVPSRGPKERRNEDKRAFQEAVAKTLPAFLDQFDGPVIVAGDLNILEPDHVPHYRVFGDWEYDFYRAFTASGLTDAFRHLHPHITEHSWFGRSGNGYRFDHAFVTTSHVGRVQTCRYLHQPRQDKLTDHSVMTLTLLLARDTPHQVHQMDV